MTVLLSCSINLLANDIQHSSTGERDSVLIAYDDLRIVNSKLIELDYEKQINAKLRNIIKNDSIIRHNLNTNIFKVQDKNVKLTRQRNAFAIVSLLTIVSTVVFIIK